jgi:hypothetical protein
LGVQLGTIEIGPKVRGMQKELPTGRLVAYVEFENGRCSLDGDAFESLLASSRPA